MDPSPGDSADSADSVDSVDSVDSAQKDAQEDARRLVEQLRSAPAETVVAEVLSTLLTAADVKLGRRDARLFIDLCASTLEHAGPYVSQELRTQVEQALGQLRLSQVGAESHRGQGGPEPNDLDRAPTPPTTGARADAPTADRPSPASRLWVPGR